MTSGSSFILVEGRWGLNGQGIDQDKLTGACASVVSTHRASPAPPIIGRGHNEAAVYGDNLADFDAFKCFGNSSRRRNHMHICTLLFYLLLRNWVTLNRPPVPAARLPNLDLIDD